MSWSPAASHEMLLARARLLEEIRVFFYSKGVIEVDTPTLSAYLNTDPALHSFSTRYTGPGAVEGQIRYLHTSPEFPMKRMLAAGSGPIYQICKVFRDGEKGRFHNPEFTLLEWYRPGFSLRQLMDEVEQMIMRLLPERYCSERFSYKALFQSELSLDPHTASLVELRDCAVEQGIGGAESLQLVDRDGWLELLMSHCIEPQLGRNSISFVYDYPATQASLAKLRQDEPIVAERFELYCEGLELANGFLELTDAEEQLRRFEQDLARCAATGSEEAPIDKLFLQALEAGMPDCSGVALGVDRLLMRIVGASHINEVIAFPFDRA